MTTPIHINRDRLICARFGLAFETCTRPSQNIDDAIALLDDIGAQLGISRREMEDPPIKDRDYD